MQHHIFSVEIAKEYGVNLAIFLCNMSHWIQKNIANNTNFRDGRYWTYNTAEAYTILFPYWSVKQIRTIINKCIKEKLIEKGIYHKASYDKKSWYTLTEKGMNLTGVSMLPNGNMEVTKQKHRGAKKGTSIKNTDINTDIKPKRDSKGSPNSIPFSDDFYPEGKAREALTYHAQRTNNSEFELLEKFERVSKKYKTKSNNWQKTFIDYLERELPKRTYTNKNGGTERYDGKARCA